MISINYQKLTANMLTGENRTHYHKGKSKTAVLLLLFSQGEDLVRILIPGPHPQFGSVPLEVWPGNLHFTHNSV